MSTTITNEELVERFNETLDASGPVIICEQEFLPSRILKKVDPTAYDMYLYNFEDAISYDGITVEDN